MKTHCKVLSVAGVSLVLALGSLSAHAVSPAGGGTLIRNNTAGTSFLNLSASATSFCYLSRVGVTDTDTGSETADCKLTKGALVWTLEASLGASSDADVRCSATCYKN